MSPNRIFEKVARCGPPVSVVDTWHGPAFTHLTGEAQSPPSFQFHGFVLRSETPGDCLVSKRMRKTVRPKREVCRTWSMS
jgi:hypothetical protein